MVLVDVREKEEYRAGYIPGAISLPRGFLEMQVEQKLPDKNAPIVVYCAGGHPLAPSPRRPWPSSATPTSRAPTRASCAGRTSATRWRRRPQLTDAQRDRYSRHILLPEVGEAGQAKLLEAKVLLLGAGGLGSPAALYLAAAGVGTLGIVDADTVDASNLQRQILHATSRVGTPKVESAEKAIRDLNPDVKVVKFQERLNSANVDRIFEPYDVIVDGCDNFPTRYLVNDASVFLKKPVVHGSIFRFDGQVTTFVPGSGPCYRCLYPEPPPAHLAPSLPGGGRARHPLRHRRHAAGHRGHQDHPRQGRPARRPPPDLRLAEDEVPRAQAARATRAARCAATRRPSRATSTTKASARRRSARGCPACADSPFSPSSCDGVCSYDAVAATTDIRPPDRAPGARCPRAGW